MDAARELALLGAEDVEDRVHAVDKLFVHYAEARVVEEPVSAMAARKNFVYHFFISKILIVRIFFLKFPPVFHPVGAF